MLKWMEQNGYGTEVKLLYYKQICAALLSDFLHFVYEALQCSRKGKLTVTYALLRKPLKDNLFLLEWLLARPKDFLIRFEGETPKRFKMDSQISADEQVLIIGEAVALTSYGSAFPAEFLHELRFRKDSPIGMEPAWQKANHLVTSFRFLQTEACNFNFVFSDDDARRSQWEGLYLILPILLFHAVQVVEALFANFARRKDSALDLIPLRTVAGLLLWMKEPPVFAESNEGEEMLLSQLTAAELICPNCNQAVVWDSKNLLNLYKEASVFCPRNCGEISPSSGPDESDYIAPNPPPPGV